MRIKKHIKKTGRDLYPGTEDRYKNMRRKENRNLVKGVGAAVGAGALPGPNVALVGAFGGAVKDTISDRKSKKKAFAEGYMDALLCLESTVARGYKQKPGNLMNPNKKAFAQRNNEM